MLSEPSDASSLEARDHVRELLDGLNLRVQVVVFEEVCQVGVVVLRGQLVHVQERLVDFSPVQEPRRGPCGHQPTPGTPGG